MVLEGRIEDIVFKGEGAERFGVRRLLQPVLAQRPLSLDKLEHHLLLVNDTPGVRILDVSIEEIGESDWTVSARRAPGDLARLGRVRPRQ